MANEWYLYVLECDDDTLYTGITTDLERRVREHNGKRLGGANYTRARRPVEPVAVWPCDDQSEAARTEAAFKSLSREEKLRRLNVGLTPSTLESIVDEYLSVLDISGADPGDFRPLALTDRGDRVERDDVDLALRMFDRLEAASASLADIAPSPTHPPAEPVFFVGPGLFDGHALELDETPTVFFDVRLLRSHFDDAGFDPDVHAAHEWTHAVHYASAPAFYPGRDKSPSDAIWHRLVAEGLAIRVSERITDVSPRLSCWFGFLGADEFDAWQTRAEQRRADLGAAVAHLEDSVRFDDDLWDELLRATETPDQSRLGYWYGRQIVDRAERDRDLDELLSIPPVQWRPYVRDYFEDGG